MIRYFFICLAFLIVGAMAQQWVYGLDFNFLGGRVLILPLFFFCIAHAQRYTATLIFALLTGLIWDADHCLGALNTSPSPDIAPALENLRFGYSIILFGILGFVIKLAQSLLPIRGVLVSTVTILIAFYLYMILEAVLFSFVRGALPENWSIFSYITRISLLSTMLAPVILFLLGLVWKLLKSNETGYAVGLVTLISKEPRR